MNTRKITSHSINGTRLQFVRVALIEVPGDNCVVIDWRDDTGFLAFFDGGVWPDGDDHKVFDSLSSALTEIAGVVEDYLEETGEAYSEEFEVDA